MESSSSFPRLFTVEEANALLPALRPLVEGILDKIRRLKAKSAVVIRDHQIDPEAPDLMNRLHENPEIAALIKEIKRGVDEIEGQGCMCKGLEQGLLDFPCQLGEEIVFLCWQYGEAGVNYWHRVED
ncbi:MAG TPA: DUF2203 domain-containing protein, partial [Terriglobales bacterium]|nr:DUF2203 domain-containing protein [Terriglobales bacterium]